MTVVKKSGSYGESSIIHDDVYAKSMKRVLVYIQLSVVTSCDNISRVACIYNNSSIVLLMRLG